MEANEVNVVGIDGDLLGEGLKRVQSEIDSVFDAFLPVPTDTRARLVEAMRYAAIGGGKRVRPLLVVSTAELYGVDRTAALRAGAAVEAVDQLSGRGSFHGVQCSGLPRGGLAGFTRAGRCDRMRLKR